MCSHVCSRRPFGSIHDKLFVMVGEVLVVWGEEVGGGTSVVIIVGEEFDRESGLDDFVSFLDH